MDRMDPAEDAICLLGVQFSTSPSGAVKIAADVMQADTAINAQRFGRQVSCHFE